MIAKSIRGETVCSVFLQRPCTFQDVMGFKLLLTECVNYWLHVFIVGSLSCEKSGYLIFGIFVVTDLGG